MSKIELRKMERSNQSVKWHDLLKRS